MVVEVPKGERKMKIYRCSNKTYQNYLEERNIVLHSNPSGIPSILYHATYRPYLQSIFKKGLQYGISPVNWEFSENVVYLSSDIDEAISYAETSDIVPEEYLDQIVILAVDVSQLDVSKLVVDENVLYNMPLDTSVEDDIRNKKIPEKESLFEYHGVIPPSSIKLVR